VAPAPLAKQFRGTRGPQQEFGRPAGRYRDTATTSAAARAPAIG